METTGYPRAMTTQSFHGFRRLVPELRHMIWKECIYVQDRPVKIRSESRRVVQAPCPKLFLVCQESKIITQKAYYRLRNADITMKRAFPWSSHLAGPLVCFEADIFLVTLPEVIDNVWGRQVSKVKRRRVQYPWSFWAYRPMGPTERAIDRFCATPLIRRIVVAQLFPSDIDVRLVATLILQLSGDHRGNAAERYLSGLYKWLRAVDEVWVPSGNNSIVRLLKGDTVKKIRSGKPNLAGIRLTHATEIQHIP